MVRRERLHCSLTTATVRPPLQLNEDAVADVLPYDNTAPGITPSARDGLGAARPGRLRRAQ